MSLGDRQNLMDVSTIDMTYCVGVRTINTLTPKEAGTYSLKIYMTWNIHLVQSSSRGRRLREKSCEKIGAGLAAEAMTTPFSSSKLRLVLVDAVKKIALGKQRWSAQRHRLQKLCRAAGERGVWFLLWLRSTS
jgi:hypothetical protein